MIRFTDYSLKSRNTFAMDVKCQCFLEYENEDELMDILGSDIVKDNKFCQIGGGSNLLFTSDYEGVILHSAIKFIRIHKETDTDIYLEAGSGVVWDDFCRYTVENGYYGAENLSYIPGEVGASAVQNIGAYGVEAADIIYKVNAVDVLSRHKISFAVEECGYGYRQSVFKKELKGRYIVTSVIYRLSKSPMFKLDYGNLKTQFDGNVRPTLPAVRQAIIDVRRSKLPEPSELGNAGSFFMNPVISKHQYQLLKSEYADMPMYEVSEDMVKVPAAWLIDKCGLKGEHIGKAAVHNKQCLVIVNLGGATAAEIIKLAERVCAEVEAKFGILIHPEVIYI